MNGTLPGSPPHSAELLDRDGDRLIVQYRTMAALKAAAEARAVRSRRFPRPDAA